MKGEVVADVDAPIPPSKEPGPSSSRDLPDQRLLRSAHPESRPPRYFLRSRARNGSHLTNRVRMYLGPSCQPRRQGPTASGTGQREDREPLSAKTPDSFVQGRKLAADVLLRGSAFVGMAQKPGLREAFIRELTRVGQPDETTCRWVRSSSRTNSRGAGAPGVSEDLVIFEARCDNADRRAPQQQRREERSGIMIAAGSSEAFREAVIGGATSAWPRRPVLCSSGHSVEMKSSTPFGLARGLLYSRRGPDTLDRETPRQLASMNANTA